MRDSVEQFRREIPHGEIVELRTRISVRNRNLNGLHIKFFGECNGIVDRLMGFAG